MPRLLGVNERPRSQTLSNKRPSLGQMWSLISEGGRGGDVYSDRESYLGWGFWRGDEESSPLDYESSNRGGSYETNPLMRRLTHLTFFYTHRI